MKNRQVRMGSKQNSIDTSGKNSDMLQCFDYACGSGKLLISQRRGIITLIPKPNKDTTVLNNLRPISLLNTDYKILTKVIAKRLEKVRPK